mgnify:CR=1 FL=1|tara:strand:+ start:1924 stop:2922 length:999 start_codon:yes stop_codon:yes gene_type:complete
MSRILVTGADGFIGSHLVELTIKRGFKVRAFCFYNSQGSWGWLENLPKDIQESMEVYLGDIRDYKSVKNAMSGCDQVFHLASLIAIPYSYRAPSSYIETNINGTLNILESAKELGIEHVVHTSTSETYGTARYVPIDEKHPISAQSPYAASKIGADQIALSYWRSFSTPVSIIRPFNTYGPRQSTRAVIPTIITQIAAGETDIKLGKLTPTRDFNFVEDTCESFLSILSSKKTIGKIINSASNFEISIGDTAKLISEVMNKKIQISTEDERLRPENSEVERLFGDNSLLKEITGWEPKYSGIEGFKKGLKITANWFANKDNLKSYKIGNYSI